MVLLLVSVFYMLLRNCRSPAGVSIVLALVIDVPEPAFLHQAARQPLQQVLLCTLRLRCFFIHSQIRLLVILALHLLSEGGVRRGGLKMPQRWSLRGGATICCSRLWVLQGSGWRVSGRGL